MKSELLTIDLVNPAASVRLASTAGHGGKPATARSTSARQPGESLSERQRVWARQDSNLRPTDYESAALTT
jgi:hypothetical protein